MNRDIRSFIIKNEMSDFILKISINSTSQANYWLDMK